MIKAFFFCPGRRNRCLDCHCLDGLTLNLRAEGPRERLQPGFGNLNASSLEGAEDE